MPPPPVTGACVGYLVDEVGDGAGLGVADGVGELVSPLGLGLGLGLALGLPGAFAVPLNNPVDDGDTEADTPPEAEMGGLEPEPVHAVIANDTKITATTLAVRTPTKFPFPGLAVRNLNAGRSG